MKIQKLAASVICFLFALTACSSSSDSELTEATMNALYTSVAQTLSVMTAEVTEVPTQTPQSTATLIPTSTQMTVKTPTKYVATVSTCDNAIYVSDVTIPDNTIMAAGQAFTKTWSIKNTGTCQWTTSYSLVFYSGSSMGGASTAITETVSAGSSTSVSIAMVSPSTVGTYTGYWIMQNASGKTFGSPVYVSIIVSSSASTLTPTVTLTPTATTESATSTPTETPTSTPEPTATPEATATSDTSSTGG